MQTKAPSFRCLDEFANSVALVQLQPVQSKAVHRIERYLARCGYTDTLHDRSIRSVLPGLVTLISTRAID